MHCDMTAGRCHVSRGASRRTFSPSVLYALASLLVVAPMGGHLGATRGVRPGGYIRLVARSLVRAAAVGVGAVGAPLR